MAKRKDRSVESWRILGIIRSGGRHVVQVPLPVSASAVVTVSASEYARHDPDAEEPSVGANRFVGDADVWVSNVAAHGTAGQGDGYVEFVLHIDGIGDDFEVSVMADVTRLRPDKRLQVRSLDPLTQDRQP